MGQEEDSCGGIWKQLEVTLWGRGVVGEGEKVCYCCLWRDFTTRLIMAALNMGMVVSVLAKYQ